MDTLNQGKGRKLIVSSPTSWGGYHDATMRFLEVHIDFESFLHMDERLEKDDIDRLGWRSITTSDLDMLQAMAYVLYAIKVHSLVHSVEYLVVISRSLKCVSFMNKI